MANIATTHNDSLFMVLISEARASAIIAATREPTEVRNNSPRIAHELRVADSMMHRIILIVALTAALNGSTTGWNLQQAQSEPPVPCEDLTTQRAMSACFGRQARQDQARLDALLKELSGVLPKSEFTRLTAVQKAWTSYRDLHCQWQASFFEGGSIQPTERSTCLSSVIWNRIDELKLNLCEGRGLTGECAASKKYARGER